MSSMFSIVIVCYNQGKYIREAIQSALEQEEPAHEVVVVDDGSTDESKEIIETFAPQVKFVTCHRQGANRARNYGASVTSGQYLVFLDGDDAFLPWALTVYRRILEAQAHTSLLMCRLWYFSGVLPAVEDMRETREAEFVAYRSSVRRDRSFGASASALVIERTAFETVGGWSHDVFPLEDVELAVKLCCAGQAVQVLAPATVRYRTHDTNTSRNIGLFLDMVPKVVRKEQLRQYPGGVVLKIFRFVYFGGAFNYWLVRCVKSRRYKDAFQLVRLGWPMMLAHLSRKGMLRLSGQRPIQHIEY